MTNPTNTNTDSHPKGGTRGWYIVDQGRNTEGDRILTVFDGDDFVVGHALDHGPEGVTVYDCSHQPLDYVENRDGVIGCLAKHIEDVTMLALL